MLGILSHIVPLTYNYHTGACINISTHVRASFFSCAEVCNQRKKLTTNCCGFGKIIVNFQQCRGIVIVQ